MESTGQLGEDAQATACLDMLENVDGPNLALQSLQEALFVTTRFFFLHTLDPVLSQGNPGC